MKKLALLLLIIGYSVLALTYFHPGKTYTVVLGKDGYQPTKITIRRGDTVKFTTTLQSAFWPASDPHPTHTLYPAFDSGKVIGSSESWTYKFSKAGMWDYHDHISPSLRGTVVVMETNLILKISKMWSTLYKFKIEKHDQIFLERAATRCGKLENNRGDFLNCWYTFFSEVTKDFGTNEGLRILKNLSQEDMITISDCHLYADQIGIDAYWQYIAGHKFSVIPDLSICSQGFYHGFMSEHVSHGKDIKASQDVCASLSSVDTNSLQDCYIGMGNGLTFYYWELFGVDQKKIITAALAECQKLPIAVDDCVFGAYSGIDHLYDGLHGSNIQVNLKDPFFLCRFQTILKYQTYCYERVMPSLALGLNFDPLQLNLWFKTIPSVEAKHETVRRYGINLSEREAYKHLNAKGDASFLPSLLATCTKLSTGFVKDCEWGIFYNLFYQGGNVWKVACTESFLNTSEKKICLEARHNAEPVQN